MERVFFLFSQNNKDAKIELGTLGDALTMVYIYVVRLIYSNVLFEMATGWLQAMDQVWHWLLSTVSSHGTLSLTTITSQDSNGHPKSEYPTGFTR